ncbi:MAG: hypothetical protein NTV39_00790 [Candidatus Saccharibacteria bacterium]|nr:hypothetical protein [Candidatus Saccharibacteria bacterium]
MIILKATTETLRITTGAVSNIDYSISYADITTTTFAPSTAEGKVITNTTVQILGPPAASTQRQVKLITISNINASTACSVMVDKYDTGSTTSWRLSATTTLLAGETLQYVDSQGWTYYSATGAIKGDQKAGGSANQVQYNAAGVIAGEADFTYDPSTNDLTLSGADTNVILTGITNEPAAPSAGALVLYSKSVAGRMLPKWKAPSGVDTSFQANLGFNTVYLWTPATGATAIGTGFGCTWPSCTTTITHPTVATGMGNQMKVMQCANTAVANQIEGLVASTATLANVWRGNAAGQGGFFFQCRFRIMAWAGTSSRIFVGLASLTTGLVASDIYSGDLCGFDHITTDTNTTMSFATMDNVTRNRATFVVPALAAGNSYDATIYSPPGGSTIYYRLVDLLTGSNIVDSSTTTNLPRSTIFMGPQATMSGAANVGVGTTAIGINKVYVECDM